MRPAAAPRRMPANCVADKKTRTISGYVQNGRRFATNFRKHLTKSLTRLKTHWRLCDVIHCQLKRWFQELTPMPHFAQNQIGWQGFLMGYIDTAWEDRLIQEGFSRNKSRAWMISVINAIWAKARQLWLERNEITHQHQDHVSSREQRMRLEQQVRQMYRKRMRSKHAKDCYSNDHYGRYSRN